MLGRARQSLMGMCVASSTAYSDKSLRTVMLVPAGLKFCITRRSRSNRMQASKSLPKAASPSRTVHTYRRTLSALLRGERNRTTYPPFLGLLYRRLQRITEVRSC